MRKLRDEFSIYESINMAFATGDVCSVVMPKHEGALPRKLGRRWAEATGSAAVLPHQVIELRNCVGAWREFTFCIFTRDSIMAGYLRGKQAGIQNDLSASIRPELFTPDYQARYGINSQIRYGRQAACPAMESRPIKRSS